MYVHIPYIFLPAIGKKLNTRTHACHISRIICHDYRILYLSRVYMYIYCNISLSCCERDSGGKNHSALPESFIHLGTDWRALTDDRKVAWENKTTRQPASLASVDFTRILPRFRVALVITRRVSWI